MTNTNTNRCWLTKKDNYKYNYNEVNKKWLNTNTNINIWTNNCRKQIQIRRFVKTDTIQ